MKKGFNFDKAKRVGDRFKGVEVKVTVNMRLDQKVLNWLKLEAEKRGMPYQTLINSILTQSMNGQLDEKRVREMIQEELSKTG